MNGGEPTPVTFPSAAWDHTQSPRSPATRSTTPKPAWVTTLNARKSDDALLAALVRAAGDPIYGQELTGTISSWNAAAQRIYGYAADEIVGTNAVRFVPPGRPNDIPELLGRVAAGELIHDYETIHYTRDARLVRLILSLSPVTDESGTVTGAVTVARPVGEVQDYETTRQAAEERFRAILEVAPIALMIVDDRGRIEFANSRAAELFGYDRYELLALDLAELLPDRVWKRRPEIQDASPDVPPEPNSPSRSASTRSTRAIAG